MKLRRLPVIAALFLGPCFPGPSPPEPPVNPPARPAVIPAAGRSFGECMGPCDTQMTISGSEVHLRTLSWEGEVYLDNRATLTAAGLQALAGIARDLAAAELEPTYGCPDCADGGSAWLRLERGGAVSEHVYEFSNPPEVLHDADETLQGIIDAVQACRSTPAVEPSDPCSPLED